jgi:cellulose biosynthesis protein BcsQ
VQHEADLHSKIVRARERGYRWLIIDTPPGLGGMGPAAAEAADFVLIPTRPNCLDLSQTISTLEHVTARGLTYAIAIVAAAPLREGCRAPDVVATRDLLTPYKRRLWSGQITQLTAMPRAQAFAQSVTEYEPEGTSAREVRSLWHAIRRALGSRSGREHPPTPSPCNSPRRRSEEEGPRIVAPIAHEQKSAFPAWFLASRRSKLGAGRQ